MPEELHEARVGAEGLVFPGEVGKQTFELTDSGLYDAEEVQEALEQEYPEFGRWLQVQVPQEDGDVFMAAPGELVQELQELEAEPGETFRCTRCEKAGPRDSDPYEVNVIRAEEEL